MIYRKQELVQDDTGDADFPIKVIDRLESLEGDTVRFIGRGAINMRTPAGVQQFPISFEIEAGSIEEAFEQYTAHAKPKVEEVRQRLQQQLDRLREQQGNRIVTPGEGGAGPDIISFDDLQGG
ncbi:MAG: hypothetical protein R6V05_06045 [Candidatus Brocadiia bacterium]|jgi:hypothetical protein